MCIAGICKFCSVSKFQKSTCTHTPIHLHTQTHRYQSLQRSFRRTERPIIQNRNNRPVFGRNRNAPQQPSPQGGNNSLSLTLAEAEEMARNLATQGRGKSKKERSSSKAGRWFRRSKSKSTSQQTETTGNNATPTSSAPGPADETRPARSNSEELPQSPTSDTVVAREISTTAETGDRSSSLDISLNRHTSFERELTPASIMSAEFESGTDDERSLRQMASPTHSIGHRSVSSDEAVATATRATPAATTDEVVGEPSTASRQGEAPSVEQQGDTHREQQQGENPSSEEAGLRERQSSIVHGSLLTNADRTAAARARNRRRQQRLDSDELTNRTGECTGRCGHV